MFASNTTSASPLPGFAPGVGAGIPTEPIAIIGIGCRFPGGANDPDTFWKLLEEGVDAVTEVPADRWNAGTFYNPRPGVPGKTQARWGGFVEGIDRFDPHFFGISPREAVRMDPQQRLLLETAWEALEDGGQPLDRLAGTRTAVFIGISTWDYSIVQTNFRDRGFLDVYSNTGGSLSIAANRISYCFDLKGPSAAVDTACSSALVAVCIWPARASGAMAARWHWPAASTPCCCPTGTSASAGWACCRPMAAARPSTPGPTALSAAKGPDGRAAQAAGRALADGDRIYAVIRGTAVNQDGRTPGMTVPSQEAQEALLRQAYRNAGSCPPQVQYVEAHGTGTPVGDPIEARALGTVLSVDRPEGQPCLIGSVKTNIGHLEAGAGIAGLIKAALALLPPPHPRQPALQPAQPGHRLRAAAAARAAALRAVARQRRSAAGGRQLLRLRRHQRPRCLAGWEALSSPLAPVGNGVGCEGIAACGLAGRAGPRLSRKRRPPGWFLSRPAVPRRCGRWPATWQRFLGRLPGGCLPARHRLQRRPPPHPSRSSAGPRGPLAAGARRATRALSSRVSRCPGLPPGGSLPISGRAWPLFAPGRGRSGGRWAGSCWHRSPSSAT